MNTNELPTAPAKAAPKKLGFRTQVEAKNAAIFELGEFARHGFEFDTFKCDGRWFFKKCDEVRPPTAADLKASGGKKGPRADAAAREQAKHEQRGAERAAGEGRLRGAPREVVQAIPASEAIPVAVTPENAPAATTDAGDGLDLPAILRRTKVDAPSASAFNSMPTVASQANARPAESQHSTPPVTKLAKAKGKKRAAGSKTALIGSMLLDPKGCTTADVLSACNWPAVSMPQQAKACGLKLRKEKDGKVTRYFGSK